MPPLSDKPRLGLRAASRGIEDMVTFNKLNAGTELAKSRLSRSRAHGDWGLLLFKQLEYIYGLRRLS